MLPPFSPLQLMPDSHGTPFAAVITALPLARAIGASTLDIEAASQTWNHVDATDDDSAWHRA